MAQLGKSISMKRVRATLGFALLFLIITMSFQNCGDSGLKVVNPRSGNLSQLSTTAPECVFDGQLVPAGNTVVAYRTSSVPMGQVCQSEIRSCDKSGQLSGSYVYARCSEAGPASCLFNGQTLTDGQSVTAYFTSSVPAGSTCTSQTRTCSNGVLTGAFTFASCSVAGPIACTFNGVNVASGSSVMAYQASSVPSGSTCLSQARACSNGVLGGSYMFSSCSVNAALACTFNGSAVSDGQSITAFQAASVPNGSTCVQQTRTCSNGTLSGTYTFPACAVAAAASCTFNGASVASGQSVMAYQAASGATCTSQTRTCSNGTLSGTYTFPSCTVTAATATYTQVAALITSCASCHGSSVNSYNGLKASGWVVAGSPTSSKLYTKINAGHKNALSTAQKQTIFNWISAGALNN